MSQVDDEMLMKGYAEFLRDIKNYSQKSIMDDLSRIRSMRSRNIDYTKGEDCAKDSLNKSNLSESTIRSCLRLCKYYQEYLNTLRKG